MKQHHITTTQKRIATLLCAGLLGGAFFLFAQQKSEPVAPTAVEKSAIAVKTLTAQETLEDTYLSYSAMIQPATLEQVTFATIGTVQTIHVAEGDTVTQGQLLVTLDSEQTQKQIASNAETLTVAQANYLTAQQNLTDAQAQHSALLAEQAQATADYEADKATAQAELATAQSALDAWVANTPYAQALAQATARLATAKADEARAQQAYDTADATLTLARQAQATAQTTLSQAQEARVLAQIAYDKAVADKASAQQNFDTANSALIALQADPNATPDALASAQKAVADASIALTLATETETSARSALDTATTADTNAQSAFMTAQTATTKAQETADATKATLDTAKATTATCQADADKAKADYDENGEYVALQNSVEVAQAKLDALTLAYDAQNKTYEARLDVLAVNVSSAQTLYYSAQSSYMLAQNSHDAMTSALDTYTYHAKTDGVVVAVVGSEGGVVTPIAPVLVVASDKLEAQFGVSPSDVARMQIGNRASITIKEKTYTGTVSAVSAIPDEVSRTYLVDVAIDAPPSDAMIGELVHVEIFAQVAGGVWLPISVIMNDNTDYVFVVEDGRAVRKEVALQDIKDDLVMVSGICQGEQVICANMTNVKSGYLVEVQHEAD